MITDQQLPSLKLILQRYKGQPGKENRLEEEKAFVHLLNLSFQHPESFNAQDFLQFPVTTIVSYLQKTHTMYLEDKLDDIKYSIERLDFSEGEESYLRPLLLQAFESYAKELTQHIGEEEEHLIPYIKQLVEQNKETFKGKSEKKLGLLRHMLNHDDDPEQKLRLLIDLLCNDSKFNQDNLSVKVLTTKLKLLELDLQIHARLEDEVLMPMALEIEGQVFGTEKN